MHSSCRTVWCLAAVATLSVAAGVATLASDILTEGVDNARTGWVRDEKVFTTSNVAQSKLLWKVKLESTPRAMHNLFAPLVAERVTTAAGAARARRRRRRLRRSVRNRRRQRQADLASSLRQHARESGRHERHALPGRSDRRADDGAGIAGQIHGLRGVVGRPAAAGQPGRRPGRRAAREVHSRRRQAVRAQSARRRDLHRDRAGLRRPHQRVLLLRSRVTPRQRLHPCGRRLVGTPRRVDRSGRPRLHRHRRRAIRSADPASRQRHRRREARRQQAAAARRLLRRAERELAVAPRSRREHDAGGVRLRADASSSSARARSAGCGCSIATMLGGEDHRTTLHTTPLICNDAQAFDAQRRSGARSARGRTRAARVGAGAVLGTGEQGVQGADRARPADGRRRGGVQAAAACGKWQLAPAWLSRDMDLAEEAVIANGDRLRLRGRRGRVADVPDKAWNEPGGPVYGGGLSSGPARRIPTSRHAPRSTRSTRRPARNCGRAARTIESWNHFSGLTVANGRAYIATFDGVLYCFGIAR